MRSEVRARVRQSPYNWFLRYRNGKPKQGSAWRSHFLFQAKVALWGTRDRGGTRSERDAVPGIGHG